LSLAWSIQAVIDAATHLAAEPGRYCGVPRALRELGALREEDAGAPPRRRL
jgi:hypothetical protein